MIRIKKNRLVLICLPILMLFIQPAFPASDSSKADSLLATGNAYYMNHNYEMAYSCYKRVIEMGFMAADLYYNLGNACYKQNNMAEAIRYYEKALLKPGNDDIRQPVRGQFGS
jgi:tetratricopeptide (TPR) repeat protein